MGNYIINMDQGEIAKLTEEQVAFVILCHEANSSELRMNSTNEKYYEDQILSFLLPNLSRADPSNIESVWGVDVNDSSIPLKILEDRGYATPPFHQATTIHVNGGIGVSGLVIVLGPKEPKFSVNMPL